MMRLKYHNNVIISMNKKAFVG